MDDLLPSLEETIENFGAAIEDMYVIRTEIPRDTPEYRFALDVCLAWNDYLASC